MTEFLKLYWVLTRRLLSTIKKSDSNIKQLKVENAELLEQRKELIAYIEEMEI